jgi:polysaccharide biosynthesis transport protein
MNFDQFVIILRARWRRFFLVLALLPCLALIVSFILPRQYTAVASVVVDVKSPDPIMGMVLPGMIAPGYLATQLDIIQSERVARGAMKLLKLDENPTLRQQWREQSSEGGTFESWLAELLQRNLDIKPSRESSVISVSYTATDPIFAAAMANAFVRSYIDTTLELKVEPAKEYANLFNSQARQARERYERAQERLSIYQREKGLVATDERMDVENARLAELSSQLVGLQALAVESRSRKAQAGANSPDVLNNPVVGSLKSDLSRQESRLKELSARYGDAHPAVQEVRASVADIREKLSTEIGRIASGAGISNTISATRESQARDALEAQKQKLLKLKEQRDEAAVLLRDVESAQRSMEAINARLNQTSIESQSTQTNVSILKEASPPAKHSSPKTLVNTALALFVGLLLAGAFVVVSEVRDRRLRSEVDISGSLGIPLLGTMPDANQASKTFALGVRRKLPLLASRGLPELTGPDPR